MGGKRRVCLEYDFDSVNVRPEEMANLFRAALKTVEREISHSEENGRQTVETSFLDFNELVIFLDTVGIVCRSNTGRLIIPDLNPLP